MFVQEYGDFDEVYIKKDSSTLSHDKADEIHIIHFRNLSVTYLICHVYLT